MRIVTIEDHVNRPGVMEAMTWQPAEIHARLLPSVEQRIADMDAAGIDLQVLSAPLPAPGEDGAVNPLAPVQPLDESAIPLVQAANEELHQIVTAYPDRFVAFAHTAGGAARGRRGGAGARCRRARMRRSHDLGHGR